MSGEQHVPTTEEIREYVAVGGEPRLWEAPDAEADERRATAFDRWLAAHDAEVRALPDRETIEAQLAGADDLHPLERQQRARERIARALLTGAGWNEASIAQLVFHQRAPWSEALRNADSVLALFGQEGQR